MTRQSSRIHLFLTGLAVMWTLSPTGAGAFYQTSTVEGTIGEDIGGVWVAVYHMAPTFRVRVDTVEETKAPWSVAALGQDLQSLMGENPPRSRCHRPRRPQH